MHYLILWHVSVSYDGFQCCFDYQHQILVVNSFQIATFATQYFMNLMISKQSHPSPILPVSPFLSLHLELIDGTPTLKINHGSGTVVLQLPGNVNVADRRWHRLDVRSNSKVGRFTYLTPTTIYLAKFS